MADTFSAQPIVWIEVNGESLSERFVAWLQEPSQRSILSERFGSCGPSWWRMGYAPKDAEKILAWLRAQPKAKDVSPVKS